MRKLGIQCIIGCVMLITSAALLAGNFDKLADPITSPISTTLSQPRFLPADQVFIPTVAVIKPSLIKVRWMIAQGYYLYADRFSIHPVGAIQLGTPKRHGKLVSEVSQYVEPYDVYHGEVTFDIPIIQHTSDTISLKLGYQGCSEQGYCYPPIQKIYVLSLHNGSAIDVTPERKHPVPTTEKTVSQSISQLSHVTQLLTDQSVLQRILAFFVFGLLLTFTPCVLPMIPILSSIIVGLGDQISKRRALALSSLYVIGMAITYAAAGVIAGLAGTTLQAHLQQAWLLIAFSALFVALALSLFGYYEIRLPRFIDHHLHTLSQRQVGGSYVSIIIMGILSALVVSPCVTPPLIGALAYISQTGDVYLGGSLLFILGLGMGTPLIIGATLGGHLLPKAGKWMTCIKTLFGFLLLGLAIWILERAFLSPFTLFLWAILLIGLGNYLVTLKARTGLNLSALFKTLGIACMLYGGILLFAASIGGNDPLRPFAPWLASQTVHTAKPIKTIADLHKALATAKQKGQMTFLEFSADWCISCKVLQHKVLSQPDVQQRLATLSVLQADVTANDAADQALEQVLGVFAPPTLLFFDAQGQELKQYRIVGEISKKDFHAILDAIQQ